MAGAAALGCGAAVGMAAALGGSMKTGVVAAGVVLAASLVSLLPGVLRLRQETWGVAVLGASVARMLMVLALGLVIDSTAGLDRRAFWLGLVSGAVIVLIVETALAVSALQKMERQKQSSPAGRPAGREQVQA